MKFLLYLMLFTLSCTEIQAQWRKRSFDEGWRFHRGTTMGAELPDYDDSSWRVVNVPHDWSIEPIEQRRSTKNESVIGPFSMQSIGDWDTGQTVGGEGWYRKSVTLPIGGNMSVRTYLAQNIVALRFDGIYNQAEVWINGRRAVTNVYGYMPFKIELNPYFDDDPTIQIAIKVHNEGQNSRWYAGSGIFRHTWIETTDRLHLDEWDTFVDASEWKGKTANIKVFAKVFNSGLQRQDGLLCTDIIAPDGKQVAHIEKPFIAPGTVNDDYSPEGTDVDMEFFLKNAVAWSTDNPYLYKAKIYITRLGEERDALTIPFGARQIEFSAREGFKLNEKPMKLRGGCVHHDNGLLGGAAIDRADIRKVQLLKAQGYNAVRCTHNLPSTAFLDACDSIGMLVIDEVFDQWEEAKRPDDYHRYFSAPHNDIPNTEGATAGRTNAEHDMALMVRRDRNHPSVIMWSIGNEVAQRADERGREIALKLNLAANNEDHTRPTTMAVSDFWDRKDLTWEKDSPRAFENIEIAGYNYEWKHYVSDHDSFPDRIIYGSESLPKEMAQNWALVEEHPYIIGDFVWTAIDYLGEAGLAHTFDRADKQWISTLSWPWFNAWCGDIDIVGQKKAQSHYRDVLWGNRRIAMAVRPFVAEGEWEDVSLWGWTAEESHWNWDKDYLPIELRSENYQTMNTLGKLVHNPKAQRPDSLRVNVYSLEPRVRLMLNDELLEEKDTDPSTHTATFHVHYTPGTLMAQTVGSRAGTESVLLTTAGTPASIMLEAERSAISVSPNDLAYINIYVVDAEGNRCPTAEVQLQITSEGAAHTLTAGTGHPYDMYSFRSLTPRTYHGHALAILRPEGKTGTATITVSAPGLPSAQCTISME